MLWKYELPIRQEFGGCLDFELNMPEVHRWLHVDTINGVAYAWADVDLDTGARPRSLLAVGTGFDLRTVRHRQHIGTAVLVADQVGIEWLTVHIFDEAGTA